MTAQPGPTLLPSFVLDACVFIEAAKRYYAFDLHSKFWDSLLTHGNAGRLCTIDRVAVEIRVGKDMLTDWIDSSFVRYVHSSSTADTITHYSNLMRWAQGQPFSPAAKAEFATVADAWLVAYAKVVGGIVVTDETIVDANCRRKVKIPNACNYIGVDCIDTFAMLRALGIKIG